MCVYESDRKSCKFRNGAKEENPILVGSFASLLNALERIPPVSSQIPERTWKLMAGSRWYFAFKDLFGSRSFLTAANNLPLRRVNFVKRSRQSQRSSTYRFVQIIIRSRPILIHIARRGKNCFQKKSLQNFLIISYIYIQFIGEGRYLKEFAIC